jgi:mono/diheme cytochrome c family protein
MNTLRSRCRNRAAATTRAIAVLLLTAAIARSSASAGQPPAGTSTIWDGVYTTPQAERGRDAYSRACAACHRDDLSGSEDGAPPLMGPAFVKRWNTRRLSDMYFVLFETMPQDAPSSLSRQEYADIISYLLMKSGAPAGQSDLPSEMEKLKPLLFVDKPSAPPM